MAQEPKEQPSRPTVRFTVKAGHASSPQTLEVNASEGDLQPWDLDSKLRVVKTRQPRLDGPQKVTGRAKYTFDVNLPGLLHARVLRSPYAAARLEPGSVDASAAR